MGETYIRLWQCPNTVAMRQEDRNLEALKAKLRQLDGCTCEGFVLRDSNFVRLKLKHPTYVAVHAMGGDGKGKAVEGLRL